MTEPQRRILIPIDASEHSLRAFKWYKDNLWKPNDMLYLAHCLEPPRILTGVSLKSPMNIPVKEWEEEIKKQIAAGQKVENQYLSECTEKKVKHFQVQVIHGERPETAVLSYAKEKKITMIIIGNRGLGKYRRTFLGSVSDYIVHHAHVPVTIVPPLE